MLRYFVVNKSFTFPIQNSSSREIYAGEYMRNLAGDGYVNE